MACTGRGASRGAEDPAWALTPAKTHRRPVQRRRQRQEAAVQQLGLKMEGRRVRPRRAPPERASARGALDGLLAQGIAVALEAVPTHIVRDLAVWAEATLGRAALRAAVWAALLVGAPRLAPNQRPRWRAALRAVLARLDDTEPAG